MKRITIIAGHYGSGKSEICTNLAFKHKVDYIVDLDIINPYFRTRSLHQEFEDAGIHLVESTIKKKLSSDLPYISGESAIPFLNKELTAIYDLGGTENGGRVLIQFSDKIDHFEDIDLLYVVNIFRMETNTVAKIVKSIKNLENEAQLKVTGLINNTNLLKETTEEMIKEGETILTSVAKELDLPIVYTVIHESLDQQKDYSGKVIRLKRLIADKFL
ncbi:MAG: ATP-binding protein [Candidatus Izimaplasma sp.]|nr:ATP-binding protein [Candidatus Izimaplasma bacterium]